MGATYSSASAAGAFTTKRGNQLVFMWEELCESNVHPQVPTWNIVYVGDSNGAMDRVFRAAASAEGGSLRSARGRYISPEGYIGRWMKEFSNLRDIGAFGDYKFELSMGNGHYDPINIGEFESKSYPKPDVIFDTITEYGLPDAVERIKRGENVSLSLFDHGELMVMLNKMGIYIWRMMRLSNPVGWACPVLTLKFEKTNEPAPSYPMAMIIGETNFVLKEGVYRYDNDVFYNAIKTYSQHEINFPGSYKRFIKGLREHVKSSPKAPTDMVIDVIPEASRAFSDGRIEKLLGDSFTVDELLTKGNSLMVRSLWYYDVEISLERQPLTALIPMTEQMELI
jgi:hypothetical protein